MRFSPPVAAFPTLAATAGRGWKRKNFTWKSKISIRFPSEMQSQVLTCGIYTHTCPIFMERVIGIFQFLIRLHNYYWETNKTILLSQGLPRLFSLFIRNLIYYNHLSHPITLFKEQICSGFNWYSIRMTDLKSVWFIMNVIYP